MALLREQRDNLTIRITNVSLKRTKEKFVLLNEESSLRLSHNHISETWFELQGISVNRDMDNYSNHIMVQILLSTEWAVT